MKRRGSEGFQLSRAKPGAVRLHRGYHLRRQWDQQSVQIVDPQGRICLSQVFGDNGLQVELSAASVRMRANGDLTVACDRFDVRAASGISLVSGGDIAQDALGNVSVRADAEIMTESAGQSHQARLGNYCVRANDDVEMNGERLCLNCESPLPAPPATLPVLQGEGVHVMLGTKQGADR